ncbi:hypothetical protein ACFQ0Q_30175 [Streptomyces aureus]
MENLARRTTTGMRSAEFGGLRITDCLVPHSAVLGEAGDGYELSLRSSLLIRGLIPSIVLAGADTALRTVARFAGRSRADGRSSLDVRHVRDVLTGGFLDLLIIDCLALVATRALHLLPRQMSAYAAAAAYLAPKLVAESMDEMSAVLGEETFAQDGAYAMFQKQRRDLPVTSLGHAGSAGRQVSILPQLPTSHGTPGSPTPSRRRTCSGPTGSCRRWTCPSPRCSVTATRSPRPWSPAPTSSKTPTTVSARAARPFAFSPGSSPVNSPS